MRLLLARGARQEPQSNYGRTALHAAIMNNHCGVVALLCAAPGAAAALALKRNGETPLCFAIARGNATCEAVLRENNAPA